MRSLASCSSKLRRYWRPFAAALASLASLLIFALFLSVPVTNGLAGQVTKREDLWSLKPIVRPEVPQGVCSSTNPIDAFIAEARKEQGLPLLGPADKLTWLRRVSFDLIGLPPTVQEQDDFLADNSPDAMEKVTDRLL